MRCDALLTPFRRRLDVLLAVREGRIAQVAGMDLLPALEASSLLYEPGATVAPGFIDVHVHGAGGHDLMEGTLESLQVVAATLARYGTTSFLATTLSAPAADTETALRGYAAHHLEVRDGARPIGIHMEGPFLNRSRRGTHNPQYIRQGDANALRRFFEVSGGSVRKITIAPETDQSLELTRTALSLGIQVSLGHTDATGEQARAAIDAGARHSTHTFNAMRPFHQREPGILGEVLTDERVYTEIIADGVHVHPGAVRLLCRMKGIEHTVLVTDGLSAVGMPDGRYPLGDKIVTVGNGECRDAEGTLAGSTLTLDRAVRNLAEWLEVPEHEAVAAATASPARSLGLGHVRGIIAPGAEADLVFLDPTLRVVRTVVGGRTVYRAPSAGAEKH